MNTDIISEQIVNDSDDKSHQTELTVRTVFSDGITQNFPSVARAGRSKSLPSLPGAAGANGQGGGALSLFLGRAPRTLSLTSPAQKMLRSSHLPTARSDFEVWTRFVGNKVRFGYIFFWDIVEHIQEGVLRPHTLVQIQSQHSTDSFLWKKNLAGCSRYFLDKFSVPVDNLDSFCISIQSVQPRLQFQRDISCTKLQSRISGSDFPSKSGVECGKIHLQVMSLCAKISRNLVRFGNFFWHLCNEG